MLLRSGPGSADAQARDYLDQHAINDGYTDRAPLPRRRRGQVAGGEHAGRGTPSDIGKDTETEIHKV